VPGHVYVSYSHADQPYVDRLVARLAEGGLAAVADPAGPDAPAPAVEARIEASAGIVAVVSEASAATVDRDAEIAQRRGRPVFVVLLGGAVPARLLSVLYADARGGGLPDASFVERVAAAVEATSSGLVLSPPPPPAESVAPPLPWQAPTVAQPGVPTFHPTQPYAVVPSLPTRPYAEVPTANHPTANQPNPARTNAIIAGVVALIVIAGVTTAVLLANSGSKPVAHGPATTPPVVTTMPTTPEVTATPTPSDTTSQAGTVTCTWRPEPTASGSVDVGMPPTSAANVGSQQLTLTTDRGVITIQMDIANAPCTAASMAYLANIHFYDNTKCHRLVPSIFALQCGDRTGTGTGDPGYQFADEYKPQGQTPAYHAGDVAMANAGPDTNGSQFFFVYGDGPLPGNYTLFGHVVQGLDIIQAVGAGGDDEAFAQSGGGGHPNLPITIVTATADPVS
jgi:peptidyl-prolyl cis-trans isomerase B (cyclophilin B)